MAKWQLDVNLAGINPFDPTLGTALPTGAYPVRIVDSERTEGKNSVGFTCQITEGEYRGNTTWVNVGTDTAKDGNRKHWKSLMLSIGAPAADIEKALRLGDETFTGKNAFIYVRAAASDKDYDNRNFITRQKYEVLKTQNAATPSATPSPTVAIPATNGAAFVSPQPTMRADGLAEAAGGVARF